MQVAQMRALESCFVSKQDKKRAATTIEWPEISPFHGANKTGAETCALETCSFSKYAGFTGTRLGWTVIPKALKFADGSPVQNAWVRVASTVFNGASNVSQAGGLACLKVGEFGLSLGCLGLKW